MATNKRVEKEELRELFGGDEPTGRGAKIGGDMTQGEGFVNLQHLLSKRLKKLAQVIVLSVSISHEERGLGVRYASDHNEALVHEMRRRRKEGWRYERGEDVEGRRQQREGRSWGFVLL